ncbi:MAG TPA: cob(I)yrinic acid a,c-diamide adenosyltransferase [Ignavibacteriaceae bacterium]|jgi:cob(I)alamin adenosyltransferase|nr:MAG: Cob(I)yrinic acid a,c-diamide adenosyltransferase [Ignavibacteria bacterium ADurb.Bin266]OQY74296.1 MAG: ATP:cob(I)alamin adenosyltransferase [Ignavibacteriales bacterium UTCHB2]HQF43159.1 cob(I)yrinic acid a,c-diamide adenosyltransferase [Ignavibacteriaceae bacterium]HQI40074.1 cob(I)yrinic acid a,c-diamide adenosyltransferase [Ignavibacteriaceae bacterium]HQJ45231.1 cob(I)yrinic acid a,c-diamide adenosyltransferase [Ignavibacteriaceae bacterium]
MKIYTKTGDKGQTSLFGGERVPKNSQRLKAYGTIDELNSFIGFAITEVNSEEVKSVLKDLQPKLFVIGSDLATPQTEKNKKLKITRTPDDFVSEVEKLIDKFESQLEVLKKFILPGGSKGAALLHICRTIARRAEREIVALKNTDEIGDNIIIFMNRLSDLFFVLSRFENKYSNIPDTKWIP